MSDASLPEVLDRLDMELYLDREGIDYRKTHGSRGEQLNLKTCPCCGGNKWKVFINAETGLGNCFSGSCNEKLNKFKFIRAHTGLDNKGAAMHIFQVAKDMGWQPRVKTTVAVSVLSKELKLPHSYPIPIKGRNLAYLENRGIDTKTAEYFHMRFCHKGLWKYFDDAGNRRFVDFSNRIIVPVFDIDGELVSFQGRDITGTAEKKYLFPNGFAATGTQLFNAHNVHHTERVVVGEGVFDVAAQKIALNTASELSDVVPIGTFGKHLSFGHDQSQMAKFGELQRRGVREVVLMWDGEVQATDDAVEAGLMLRGLGLKVKVAMLPFGKDPNEVSPEEVVRCFYAAETLDMTSATKIRMKRRALCR